MSLENISIACPDYYIGRPVDPRMPQAHSHPTLEANLLCSGKSKFLFNGQLIALPPNQLVLFSATVPHAIMEVSPGAAFYVFGPSTLHANLPAALLEPLLNGEIWTSPINPEHPEEDRDMIERWIALHRDAHPYAEEIIQLELRARLLRFLTKDVARSPAPITNIESSRADAHLQNMLRFIHCHYRDPISNDDVAEAAGLNTRYALQVFKERTRFGIHAYVNHVRLAAAQRMLTATNETTATVAFETGFSSVSRFYQAFSQAYGMPPARYRREQAQRQPSTAPGVF